MDSFKDLKILILGGLGFIGSNLALRLVAEGAKVTLVDSMLPQYGGNLENIAPIQGRCEVNFSDIRDQHSLSYLVKGKDLIYNMAGQTSHIESMTDPMTDLEINCRSQLSLLEACREHNPEVLIVFASTRQLYGRPQYLPVDENHPKEPVDVNGVHKLAAENYLTLYHDVYGMRSVSLRLTNTYGPRQQLRGNKQGFVGIFVRMAIDREKIRVFGDGQQRRDFNYIEDVVEAFVRAPFVESLYGKALNLGAPGQYSLLDFVEILHRFCDFEHEVVPFPPGHKAIDIGDYYADASRFKEATGWEPQVDLAEGLEKTIQYFRPRASLYW
jgi:nucleoside-diphosphate-sugar epimerase